MAEKRVLNFYFDYVSPYSYLAWKKIVDLCEDYRLKLNPEPVLLGAILSHNNTMGPAEIPYKREFTFKDVMRWSARDNVIMQFPPSHPFNPLLPLRATCLMLDNKDYFRFITHLFAICWQEGADITNEAIIEKILSIYGVENGVEKANSPEIKSLLREKTENAIAKGIFGVPIMEIDNEVFWGNDRFDFLIDYIEGNDPLNPKYVQEVLSRPIGIERKIQK